MLNYISGGVYVTIKGKPALSGLGWGLRKSDRFQRWQVRRLPAVTKATVSNSVAQLCPARKLEMAAMVIYFLY